MTGDHSSKLKRAVKKLFHGFVFVFVKPYLSMQLSSSQNSRRTGSRSMNLVQCCLKFEETENKKIKNLHQHIDLYHYTSSFLKAFATRLSINHAKLSLQDKTC